MPIYKDLADMEEDERIEQIGSTTMTQRLIVGFVVDDEKGKAERYISKLKERFPGIRVMYQGSGPVAETILVKVGPPLN